MALPVLPPVHPGEILREEFLVPLKMSAGALAKHLNVPRTRIERLAAEHGRHDRYRSPARKVLRHVGRALDEPPVGLRPKGRGGCQEEGNRPNQSVGRCLIADALPSLAIERRAARKHLRDNRSRSARKA